MAYKIFSFCLMILFATQITAQKSKVEWSNSAKKIANDEYQITFTAEVEDGWYIYSQFMGDDGPVPTSFEFENAKLVGKGSEKGYKKEGFDEIFGMKVTKFGKTVTFTHTVKVKANQKTVDGYLTYMTCDDEQCLPPMEIDFSIKI